ncbi:MAG TPA: hypothetical protein LFV92_00240 [Rickettsia endosymbiont of Ceroptres masudai]|nr:hypothetical protein [Rickettsia endosymbiont of Ceroptres masudai]
MERKMSGTIGLTTGSIKTIKNTNNFNIFNWIPWSSYGMTSNGFFID